MRFEIGRRWKPTIWDLSRPDRKSSEFIDFLIGKSIANEEAPESVNLGFGRPDPKS